MRGAKLRRFIRHMQRIRKQQQRIRNGTIFRRQHGSLPPAIRMPAHHDRSIGLAPQKLNGFTKPRTIHSAASDFTGGPERSALPKGARSHRSTMNPFTKRTPPETLTSSGVWQFAPAPCSEHQTRTRVSPSGRCRNPRTPSCETAVKRLPRMSEPSNTRAARPPYR